jgi:hypothetical protein
MRLSISHDRHTEDPTEKARWFQTLSIQERAELLCNYTDLILGINPGLMELKNAQPVAGRVRVLRKA